MEGVSKQLCLKSFIYKRNEIGSESVDFILRSAKVKIPNNMSELRIVNCKISAADTAALLEGLRTTQLRRLSLVQANLNQDNLHHLLKMLTSLESLCDLDISWNSLSSRCMSKLLKVLSKNRLLQNLDISWNNIQEVNHVKNENLSEVEQETVRYLGRFIKKNPNLTMLNISNTQMGTAFLSKLIKYVSKAHALQVLDVSGNIGIDHQTKQQLAACLGIISDDSLKLAEHERKHKI